MKYWYLIPIVIVVALLSAIWFIGNGVTGKVVREPDKVTDLSPDISNVREGTIVIWSSENLTGRKDGLAQFFKSRKIEGLAINYRYSDNRLIAGLPQLTAGKPVYFEGKTHFIAYMYKLNSSQQLYFDQQLLAEGSYSGIQESGLTGMVAGYPPEELNPQIIQSFPEVLTKEQLAELQP